VGSKRLTDEECQAGVVCDQVIRMSQLKAKTHYPHTLRRIRFKDPVTQKTLVFLTNNLTLSALVIAAIYKNRWQVELFFKWIKQHLKIKHFLGNSENAVKVQIWSAITTYLLVAVIKKECHLDAPLYTILQVLSVSLLERIELTSAFQPYADLDSNLDAAKQLNLF
jgi:IS4 transposase